jgi:tellurite resistance protein TehA-like permease
MAGSKGIAYAANAVSILVDIAGLYLGYLLLQCRKIQKVFVYIFFIILIVDLIYNIYDTVKGPKSLTRGKYSPVSGSLTDTEVGVVIGVVLFALILFIVKLVFFIYIMYKLYTCSSVPRELFFVFIALIIIESVLYTLANNHKFKKIQTDQQTTSASDTFVYYF